MITPIQSTRIVSLIFILCHLNFVVGDSARNQSILDVLTIPQGQLKGQILQSRSGRIYASFSSIPYAQRPALKFEPAGPPVNWHGLLDATKSATPCPQLRYNAPTEVIGDEDCLFLTVHVPKDALSRRHMGLYPVIFFVHDGHFAYGSGDEFGGKYFLDQDVILVTSNYRLGALGFLSTGDDEIVGNMGLKDQVMALKWVQSNIPYFGGDARRVTIFGTGSGGVSAQLHMLSPMSYGLFSSVIANSGSVLVPWAISRNPVKVARKFGNKLGCNSTNSRDFKLCLKAKNFKEILLAQGTFLDWHMDPMVPFSPSIEHVQGNLANRGYFQSNLMGSTFISESPYKMILEGRFNKVPQLTGFKVDEDLLNHAKGILNNRKYLNEMNQEWNRIAPITLMYEDTLPVIDQMNSVSQKVKAFYFGNKMIGSETKENLTNMYSDRFFSHGVEIAARHYARQSVVYAYRLSFGDSQNILKNYGGRGVKAVAHGLQYFFDMRSAQVSMSSAEEAYSKKIIKLWTSFAHHGKPTDTWMSAVKWQPIQEVEAVGEIPVRYYNLDEKEFTQQACPTLANRMEFWNNLIDNELSEELTLMPRHSPRMKIPPRHQPRYYPFTGYW